MTVRFEPLLTIQVGIDYTDKIGETPYGWRRNDAVNGHFEGPKLRGRVLPGSDDWLLVRRDGTFNPHCRMLLETDDSEHIIMTYTGVRHATQDVLDRQERGEPVDPGEVYHRITPLFETASEKYDWLNRIITVGRGQRILKDGHSVPIYDIFQVL